jgi:DNA polymerase I-like protein with 3'-5' exonuclease and polymerase domains
MYMKCYAEEEEEARTVIESYFKHYNEARQYMNLKVTTVSNGNTWLTPAEAYFEA